MPVALLDSHTIARRVAELAAEIRADGPDPDPPHFIAVLKGAFVFLADLIRAFDRPLTCDFLGVSSYGAGTAPSGEVRLIQDLDHRISGRHVVLVEDIVDTGRTLTYLQQLLRARGPRSLRTVCLLDKRTRREVDVAVDYVGFVVPDHFLVGYGLDFDERYRELPYIATMDAGFPGSADQAVGQNGRAGR
jgi:hypoxanthine phosphoribosyltransferase